VTMRVPTRARQQKDGKLSRSPTIASGPQTRLGASSIPTFLLDAWS